MRPASDSPTAVVSRLHGCVVGVAAQLEHAVVFVETSELLQKSSCVRIAGHTEILFLNCRSDLVIMSAVTSIII